ncbi:putative ankyrin repeat protein L63 [Zancudomyces culisetae]|uniref:Putative ankyrin repeat protein L63 n=1 Tax=Zancudomyces culisetae TaxID=1213189 RepID=A0A1R1PPD6_ZANCU|nr:putative ankyrin repeat protein L63 [Zancudomyces culisetae]|eukprot:OMH82819.1 putative ankyrin repeat protein L63 [Zancudomyces culisetae]
MYVVIDKNTSTVVHKCTLFMNESEYLDIDIGKLFSANNESIEEETDIRISDSICIKPLITNIDASGILMCEMFDIAGESDIEMLIDICNTKFEFPPDIAGAVGTDIRCIGNKFMICCILEAALESCALNNLEFLIRVLDFERHTKISFRVLESIVNAKGAALDEELNEFVWEYGYQEEMDLLIYIICTYYAIRLDRKEIVSYLKDNYSSSKHAQIAFDAAIHHSKEDIVKMCFFIVELNSENIRKLTLMAYRCISVDLIRFLLKNSDRLEGDLDEVALKTAVKKNDYELAQEIVNKYLNTASISCLEEAVKSRNIISAKLLIESGVNLKSSEFKGIRIASENDDVDVLQLLLENGASVGLLVKNVIENLCSIKNYEIAERLTKLFSKNEDKVKVKANVKPKTSEGQFKDKTRLRFNKTILCLIIENQHYNQNNTNMYFEHESVLGSVGLYENLVEIINSGKKNITDVCVLYLTNPSGDSRVNRIARACYDSLVEIIKYIAKNDLQSTFNDTEYNEINEFMDQKKVVLNDRHYELVKSELVNRNFELLKIIVENGADIDLHNSMFLRTAFKVGDIDWIDYFISKGAKLKGGSDGFEEACRSNKIEVLKHWIKNGGVVPKNPEYECIKMACLLGNFDMVKLLVESGVDLSNPERNGVRIACRLGLKRTLKYLMDNNAILGNICRYQLERVCLIRNIDLVKTILEYYDGLGKLEKWNKKNIKKGRKLKIINHLDQQNTDRLDEYSLTKALLEKGEPIHNSDLLDGVEAAVIVANTEVLGLFLTYEFNLDDIYKILRIAVQLGNTDVVKVFMDNGFIIESNLDIVNIALETKKIEMVGLLLQHDAKNKSNSDFLRHINLDNIETLQLILACCPEIGDDSSLLQHAIEKNNIEAVKLLLKNTRSLKHIEYNYVLWACEINDLEILKLLLEKGAKIREGSESGVIETCENNNLEMLKLLLERNPNLVLEKDYGLEEAIEHENIEMVNLLVKHGADTSEYIESIMELADELDYDDLSESCEYNAGGYKKVKRS